MDRIRKHLDIITTILVLLIFIVALGVYLRAKLNPKQIDPVGATVSKDIKFADVLDFEFGTHSRTLILVLSKDCIFCTSSTPFYKQLLGLQPKEARNTQLVAIFPNDAWEAQQYLRREGLEGITSIANVSYDHLGIHATPMLILLDKRGRVLESWAGQLNNEMEKQVIDAVSTKHYMLDDYNNSYAEPTKRIRLFEASNWLYDITILPKGTPGRFKLVDAGGHGQIYVAQAGYVEKRSIEGKVLGKFALPKGVAKAAVCVDGADSVHFVTPKAVFTYDQNGRLKSPGGLPLPQLKGDLLAAKCSNTNNNIFVLSFSVHDHSSEQVLYRFDLITGQTNEIHRAHLPYTYNTVVGLGKMDFVIGDDKLYVSDISDYKLYMYSLNDYSLLNTFSRQYSRRPIRKIDGKLESRGVTIEDPSQNGQITHYPAIFNLNYILSRKQLLVWTSVRNSSHNQAVDIYDSNMSYLGTDFKPTDPVFADYYFVDDKVIVPDYGFGKDFYFDFLSPLEVPYTPRTIKIFRLSNISGAP